MCGNSKQKIALTDFVFELKYALKLLGRLYPKCNNIQAETVTREELESRGVPKWIPRYLQRPTPEFWYDPLSRQQENTWIFVFMVRVWMQNAANTLRIHTAASEEVKGNEPEQESPSLSSNEDPLFLCQWEDPHFIGSLRRVLTDPSSPGLLHHCATQLRYWCQRLEKGAQKTSRDGQAAPAAPALGGGGPRPPGQFQQAQEVFRQPADAAPNSVGVPHHPEWLGSSSHWSSGGQQSWDTWSSGGEHDVSGWH